MAWIASSIAGVEASPSSGGSNRPGSVGTLAHRAVVLRVVQHERHRGRDQHAAVQFLRVVVARIVVERARSDLCRRRTPRSRSAARTYTPSLRGLSLTDQHRHARLADREPDAIARRVEAEAPAVIRAHVLELAPRIEELELADQALDGIAIGLARYGAVTRHRPPSSRVVRIALEHDGAGPGAGSRSAQMRAHELG